MSKGKLACVIGAFGVAVITVAAAVDAPVADMAMARDLEGVSSLLDGGGDVNAALGDGMTGLHWAAKHGDVEMTAILIDAGANPEAVTRIGEHTPLHVASTAGHGSVVSALVEAGADVSAATTAGATPLHFAAASGSAEAVAVLLDRGADPDAREPQWGQTPLMFAAAAGRADAITALLDGGADPRITARVVDIAARSETDQEDRRQRSAQMAALQESRIHGERVEPTESVSTAEPTRGERRRRRSSEQNRGEAAVEVDLQEEPEPLGFPDLVGTHGGLTALLLAAREGHVNAALALLDGGADINQVSAADNTSPILIAAINGHFDLAMLLLEQRADPSLASAAGATPLYAALNMQWAPKARHPQPTDYLQQEVSYLQLMKAVLEAGVDPNVRLTKSLWFTTYNRDLLGVNRAGASPFWRAAYALDIEAMQLLLAYGGEPGVPTIKTPQRRRRGADDTDHSGLLAIAMGGPGVYPIHAASGVGYGQGFAGNTHRHVPDAWLPAVKFLVEELGADVNARDHNGYNPVHHAAARGDNELILYLVEQGADVTAVSRRGQTTADMANGPVQRVQPFPETLVLLESLGATNNHNCVSC
jgi:ankyrin repeat protein